MAKEKGKKAEAAEELYTTLGGEGEAEMIEKKSIFIGQAAPAKNEAEALAFIEKIRHRHGDAAHNVWAYMVNKGASARYTDGGEPQDTAGIPILDVIRKNHFTDAVIVVTRYFGGILLGTGGLVRAYSEASRMAVQAAGMIRMEWTARFLCEVPYPCWDSLQHAVKTLPVRLEDILFESAVSFTLFVRQQDQDQVLDTLMRVTNRSLTALPEEAEYAFWPVAEASFSSDES